MEERIVYLKGTANMRSSVEPKYGILTKILLYIMNKFKQ